MREAPSLVIIKKLLEAGASICAYDPVAMNESKRRIGDTIEYASGLYEALKGADCLVIITEWDEFKFPNFAKVKKLLKNHVIFDGRNIYDADEITKLGFEYSCIGISIKK